MGLALRKRPVEQPEFAVSLHRKQAVAFDSIATEILYGGAAGGGKSHLMRSAAIMWALTIPGIQIYLFRRTHVDLVKNHLEGPKGLRAMLAPLVASGHVKIVDDAEVRFGNGARIYLCHCKDAKDVYKYQGAEIHVLLIDELTHWLEGMYRFLRNRVRMVGIDKEKLPPEYQGRFPRILCSANPGNVGHVWVKETFVDQGPLDVIEQPEGEGGMLRQYIPARLDDNPALIKDDPGYEKRLGGLGSPALVKAMRDGDWNIVEGAFFEEICDDHKLDPFVIPDDWTRFVAMDWGSAKPFSVGWYAVAGDDFVIPGTNRYLPRGALVRYREWYGIAVDKTTGRAKADTGLKLDVEAVARGIKQRSQPDIERGIKYAYVVVDPAMYKQDGGPSQAERMMKAGIRNIRPADNSRVAKDGAMGGWDIMRARLRGQGWNDNDNIPGEDWRPMLYVFKTCKQWWRTVPVLQHDPDRPEDVNTDMEDHCFVAGTLVDTDRGPVAIERLPSSGYVNTLVGVQRYRNARRTRRNAELVRVTFADGRSVTCTPDHRFLVGIDEWRYAKDLLEQEVLCAPPSSAIRSRSSTAFGTTSAGATSSARARGFTSRCGNTIMGLFRKGITSITKKPALTTPSLTSNQSPWLSTLDSGTASRAENADASTSRWPVPLPLAGTGPTRATAGTVSITRGIFALLWNGARSWFARNAGGRFNRGRPTPSTPSSATPIARRARCVSVERLNERADVYCLTVPTTGSFTIAGGLIVSNCGDETRYACMSRPWVRVIKPEEQKPQELAYTAIQQPDGSVILQANMGVRQRVEMLNERARKRRRRT